MTKLKKSSPIRQSTKTIKGRLLEVLQRVNRPGTFLSYGSLSPVLPGLEIANLGTVGFPLSDLQAESIRKLCEQAPYGKGEHTLVNTNVRRVWQMMPDKFRMKNPKWSEFVLTVVKTVEKELGLEEQQLEPHLYNLLLYEPGSFFLPHRDGEKVDKMVATLVLVLPSVFQGGELIVRHEGQETVIDFGAQADCEFQTHYAAFYADCEHEVMPLREGFRLCLVYNLVLRNEGSVTAPRNSEHIDKLAQVLRDWTLDAGEAVSTNLIFKLDHRYSRAGLAWDTLKGIDRARAQILSKAAEQAACIAHIAELTYWEQGLGGEGFDSSRRGYRHRERDTKTTRYVMHDVYETSLSAQLWVVDDGNKTMIGELPVDEDDVIPPDGLTDISPEEQFEGYMGNYGETLERWYRHAAIVLWPKKYNYDVVCELGTAAAISELKKMIQEIEVLRSERQVDLRTECIQLAQRILDEWSFSSQELTWNQTGVAFDNDADDDDDDEEDDDDDEVDDDYSDDDSSDDDEEIAEPDEQPGDGARTSCLNNGTLASFLICLETLSNTTLIQEFLRKVVPKDKSVQIPRSFLDYCGELGLTQFQKEFRHIFRTTTPDTIERNIQILYAIRTWEFRYRDEYRQFRSALIQELLSALKDIDKQKDDWRLSKLNRSVVVANLVKILIETEEFEGLDSLVAYILSAPQVYTPHSLVTLLCQLNDWLLDHCKHTCAVKTCLDSAVSFLKDETTYVPQMPVDCRRDAKISCRCDDCKELINFLESPTESIHRFKVNANRRGHLHQKIESNNCDVNHVTDRKGSPQTLVCTKNMNSYQRRLDQYRKDNVSLEVLQSLQSNLCTKWL